MVNRWSVPEYPNRHSHPVEYKVWSNMKQRCTNPKHKDYRNYGGRGISIHPEWGSSFCVFMQALLDAIGARPSKEYSIDRIDNDGNYEPGNVRWATREQQLKNKRNPVRQHSLDAPQPQECREWFRDWDNRGRAAEFASALGVSKAMFSMWLNGQRRSSRLNHEVPQLIAHASEEASRA